MREHIFIELRHSVRFRRSVQRKFSLWNWTYGDGLGDCMPSDPEPGPCWSVKLLVDAPFGGGSGDASLSAKLIWFRLFQVEKPEW